MIWEFWLQIAYMVQILAACCIFIIPARKRTYFPVTIIGSSIFWLLTAYVLQFFFTPSNSDGPAIFIWSLYAVMAVLYIWSNIDSSITEAVFCAVVCCGIQHIAFDLCEIVMLIYGKSDGIPGLGKSISMVLIYLLVYFAGYRALACRLLDNGRYVVSKGVIFPLAAMILLVWVISVLELSTWEGFHAGVYSHMIYRVLDSLCCLFVLWVQIDQKEKMKLQRELDGINSAVRQQQQQYRITSETIDSINRKCHDLKHQVRVFREYTNEKELREYLNEIENDVMIYDTALQTGNKALDTVLMEKGLFCKDHHIEWSCMADGTKLSFMKIEDIYAVFGNALDNAVTAVMSLDDPEKRVISVRILEQNQILLIQIQNYYNQQLQFENGLPLTTKKNKSDHGYGMKSIRYIVESYNGTVTVQAQDGIFMLQILLPIAVTESVNDLE